MTWYSQCGQDAWVCEVLGNKKNGVFVEIGSYDGIESSNTLHLEKELGWTGLCIESNPGPYAKCVINRTCPTIWKAVLPYKGYCVFDRIWTHPYNDGSHPNAVPCDLLDTILDENKLPRDIDYISFDTEGHEFSILETFPFDKWNVKLMTIEHNLYLNGPALKNATMQLMLSKGYICAKENMFDANSPGPYEDWFIKI